MTLWLLIFAVPVAVFLIVAIDAALEWRDRRREPEPCSHYNRCPECGEGS
jgi:hypothetical protein